MVQRAAAAGGRAGRPPVPPLGPRVPTPAGHKLPPRQPSGRAPSKTRLDGSPQLESRPHPQITCAPDPARATVARGGPAGRHVPRQPGGSHTGPGPGWEVGAGSWVRLTRGPLGGWTEVRPPAVCVLGAGQLGAQEDRQAGGGGLRRHPGEKGPPRPLPGLAPPRRGPASDQPGRRLQAGEAASGQPRPARENVSSALVCGVPRCSFPCLLGAYRARHGFVLCIILGKSEAIISLKK